MSPLEGTDFIKSSLELGSFGTKTYFENIISVKIDERGRVSLPADLRRSLGLGKGDELILRFSLIKSEIILKRVI